MLATLRRRLQVPATSPLLLVYVAALLHGAAIVLFLNGFFLTRFEIPTRSSCHLPPHHTHQWHVANTTTAGSSPPRPPPSRSVGEGPGSPAAAAAVPPPPQAAHDRWCWMPRRYRRALFVIVDALRFDFALPQRSFPPLDQQLQQEGTQEEEEEEEDYFANNLPVIGRLLTANASQALLFRFVADAPTTTLQRLKALTTGGIPTFLEAKNNFDSAELSEDNLLLQLRDNGRGAVFMGDDTWAKLFPPHKRYFSLGCHPYPSFNVKVSHTRVVGLHTAMVNVPPWPLIPVLF